MHRRQPVPQQLIRLAAAQAGVISREQALGLGVSRHVLARMSREDWGHVCQGVHSVRGVPDWAAVAWAGVLVGGDRARIGGRAAGYLGGLIDQPPEEILVWVGPNSVVPRRQPEVPTYRWVFRRDRRGVRGRSSVGHPPRLPIADTVIDLAIEGTEAEAVGWLTTAVQRRLVSPSQLRRALDRRRRVHGRRFVEQVLADAADGAQSPLELRYLRDVERAHGLPKGRRQVRRRHTVADVLYAECGLLVELDGRLGHTGAGVFRDLERDNLATSDGLASLRYGWADVTGRPCAVAGQVVHNLQLRGWRGQPSSCGPRCSCVPDLAA